MNTIGRRLSAIRVVVGGQIVELSSESSSDDDSSMSSAEIEKRIKGSQDDLRKKMPVMPDPTEKNPSMENDSSAANRRQSLFGRQMSMRQPSMRQMSMRQPSMRQSLVRRESLFMRDTLEENKPRIKPALRVGRRLSTALTSMRNLLKKKSVSIVESNNTTEGIERLQDLDKEMIDAIWFTDDEIHDMKQEMDQIAGAMDMGETDVDGRGLENRTEEGNWLAYKARMDATNAVLDEQDKQLRQRVKLNDEGLRAAYLEVSEKFGIKAHFLALQDEKDAMDILQDTKKQFEAWQAKVEEMKQKRLSGKDSGEKGKVSFAEEAPAQRPGLGKRRQSCLKNSDTPSSPQSPQRRMQRKQSWFVRAVGTFDKPKNGRPNGIPSAPLIEE